MRSVAVITRTKDRPVLLQRALESVADQDFYDLRWVVVNDGGQPEPVDAIVEKARSFGVDATALHHPQSFGMEAASNAGIRACESEFVVIHDDDDSWDPRFLAKTTALLREAGPDSTIAGVVTRSTRVIETMHGDSVTTSRTFPHDSALNHVTLFQVANLNHVFPPISFLYRRAALERVGLYREDLPVLGDWEFNMRFLQSWDIAVIPEYLALYHWRSGTGTGLYGNTVTDQKHLHGQYAAMLRNELLRSDLESGRFGLGAVVNLAQEFRHLEERLGPLIRVARQLRSIAAIAKRLVPRGVARGRGE